MLPADDAHSPEELDELREERKAFRESMRIARGDDPGGRRNPYYDCPPEQVAKWRNYEEPALVRLRRQKQERIDRRGR